MLQRGTLAGRAKVAVAITFDVDADRLLHLAHPRDSISRVSTLSMLRYGPEVALPRILEGLPRGLWPVRASMTSIERRIQ